MTCSKEFHTELYDIQCYYKSGIFHNLLFEKELVRVKYSAMSATYIKPLNILGETFLKSIGPEKNIVNPFRLVIHQVTK